MMNRRKSIQNKYRKLNIRSQDKGEAGLEDFHKIAEKKNSQALVWTDEVGLYEGDEREQVYLEYQE